MNNAGLGHDDELPGGAGFAIADHFFGRANRVREVSHFTQAFGMNDHLGVGEGVAQPQQVFPAELDVRVTIAAPKGHWAPGLFHDPGA